MCLSGKHWRRSTSAPVCARDPRRLRAGSRNRRRRADPPPPPRSPSWKSVLAALHRPQGYQRFDLEAFLPNIGGDRNHADVWFSHLQRDRFLRHRAGTSHERRDAVRDGTAELPGIGVSRLTNHLQGGVYTQIMNARSSLEARRHADHHILRGRLSSRADRFGSTRTLSYGVFLATTRATTAIGLDARRQHLRPRRVAGRASATRRVVVVSLGREGIRRAGIRSPGKSGRRSSCVPGHSSRPEGAGKSDSLLRPLMAGRPRGPAWLPFLSFSREQRALSRPNCSKRCSRMHQFEASICSLPRTPARSGEMRGCNDLVILEISLPFTDSDGWRSARPAFAQPRRTSRSRPESRTHPDLRVAVARLLAR